MESPALKRGHLKDAAKLEFACLSLQPFLCNAAFCMSKSLRAKKSGGMPSSVLAASKLPAFLLLIITVKRQARKPPPLEYRTWRPDSVQA